jgi:hypothetical protein
MKKSVQRLMIPLLLLIVLLSGCSGGSFQGYLVNKVENDKNRRIMVIRDITTEDIEKKSVDELIQEAADKNTGHAFYVDKETYDNLEVGQKIIVYYKSDTVQESNPPITGANKVKILEE